MTNLARKMAREKGWRSERPQDTILHDDGGYSTLHPTKGWRRVSGARVAAREKMALMGIRVG